MFDASIYQDRREKLYSRMSSGLVVLLGHTDSPINYQQNVYPFRQDGTFSYFFGINRSGLGALIDLDEKTAKLFGDELEADDEIWHGESLSLNELAEKCGCSDVRSYSDLTDIISAARKVGRVLHIVPPYRADTRLEMCRLINVTPAQLPSLVSTTLVEAIVSLRQVKAAVELFEIEETIKVTELMHRAAMLSSRPGVMERDVVAEMRHVMERYGLKEAYAPIFSRQGQILHNHGHNNVLRQGDLVVNDYGASSPLGYATDVTRTLPIGGRFKPEQRDLYQLLYDVQRAALTALRPGVPFLTVHRIAALHMVDGMRSLGFFKGDANEIVDSGAYALCFPHGLGHQLGLDVHDMESFGEDKVGYDEEYSRSSLFGLKYLRLAKPLVENMVVTIEPGIYFIPALIRQWSKSRKHVDFINYSMFNRYVDFGGMRIEDDVLISSSGHRVLGAGIPKKIEEIESLLSC